MPPRNETVRVSQVLAILMGMALSGGVLPQEGSVPVLSPVPLVAAPPLTVAPAPAPAPAVDLPSAGLLDDPFVLPAVFAPEEPLFAAAVEVPYVWPDVTASDDAALMTETRPFPRLVDQPEFWLDWRQRKSTNLLFDICSDLMTGPEAILDETAACLAALRSPLDCQTWDQCEQDPICLRVLDFQRGPRQERLFSALINNWIEREQRHFTGFADSELYTFDFEDGNADINEHRFRQKQRKIAWDALKRTYMGKYKFRAEDTLRDDAFQFNEWVGVDYILLPPMLATYVYYRGFDKRISVGPTRVNLSIEPLNEILHDDRDAAVSLEWMVKGFPIGLLVSVGVYDGKAELDFIGIGTSLDAALKAIALQAPRERD